MTETAAQTLPCDHEGVGRPGCHVCDPAARARTYEVHATAQWTPTPQARELKHLALHVAKTAGNVRYHICAAPCNGRKDCICCIRGEKFLESRTQALAIREVRRASFCR